MRNTLLILLLTVGLAAPAAAKKTRHHHPKAAPTASAPKADLDRAALPPKTNAATDYEKAKAELDDLKSSREIPVVSLDNQAGDRENPLMKK